MLGVTTLSERSSQWGGLYINVIRVGTIRQPHDLFSIVLGDEEIRDGTKRSLFYVVRHGEL